MRRDPPSKKQALRLFGWLAEQVLEARELPQKRQLDLARGPVALLGDNQLGQAALPLVLEGHGGTCPEGAEGAVPDVIWRGAPPRKGLGENLLGFPRAFSPAPAHSFCGF